MSHEGQRSVLMGDPSHFSVQGGANPHTRTRWGTKRRVDRAQAIEQWHGLKRTLEDRGLSRLMMVNFCAQSAEAMNSGPLSERM